MIKIRNALRKVSHDLGMKGHYTNADVIREFRARNSHLIDAKFGVELQNIGLRKILSDVNARQAKTYDDMGQGEFFPELVGLPESFDAKTLGLAETKGERVLLQSLDIEHVKKAIESAPRPIRKNSAPSDKLRNFLAGLEPFIKSDKDILADVIKRWREERP
jgi:hypothetical protein